MESKISSYSLNYTQVSSYGIPVGTDFSGGEVTVKTTVKTHLSSDIRLITVKLLLACSFQGVLILFKAKQATVRGALSPV